MIKKLRRDGNYDVYNDVIEEQLQGRVIEIAPSAPTGKEYYILYKRVTKQDAETNKLRIVYDASARENFNQPSLNDCLHPGPSLQNLLWNILIRSRFYTVILTGDLRKAFLQIRKKEEDTDSLRFHRRAPDSDDTRIYRFSRGLFGVTSSPFLLAGVIDEYLKAWEHRYPEVVKELRDGLYVDDLMMGDATVPETKTKKSTVADLGYLNGGWPRANTGLFRCSL